jgi:hypothetical protein
MATKTKTKPAPVLDLGLAEKKRVQREKRTILGEIDQRFQPKAPTKRRTSFFTYNWHAAMRSVERAAEQGGHVLPVDRGGGFRPEDQGPAPAWEDHLTHNQVATSCVKCGLGAVIDGGDGMAIRGTLHLKPCEYADHLLLPEAAAAAGIPLKYLREWVGQVIRDVRCVAPRGIRTTRRLFAAAEVRLLKARAVCTPRFRYERDGKDAWVPEKWELLSRAEGEKRLAEEQS